MAQAFLTTYLAVLFAEIVGDKLLYTSAVLATRFRWRAVLAGMALAFMGKISVAVALGAAIGTLLPTWLTAALTAASFAGVAITMARSDADTLDEKSRDPAVLKGATVAFTTIFCSEWADKGMITTGAMAATWFGTAPSIHVSATTIAVVVWVAAVAAMVSKGAAAALIGASVRRWISARVSARHLKVWVVAATLILGLLSVFEVVGILKE